MTELPVYDEIKRVAMENQIVQPGFQTHIFSVRAFHRIIQCNLSELASIASMPPAGQTR